MNTWYSVDGAVLGANKTFKTVDQLKDTVHQVGEGGFEGYSFRS